MTGEPIHEIHSEINSNSIFIKPQSHSNSEMIINPFECDFYLDNSNLEKLKSIYWVLQSVNGADSDCIIVAQEMYRNALYQPIRYEGKIAFAMASLEALFTENDGDFTYKLYIRVSQFLKMFDYVPENEIETKVFNKVKNAYDVRSKYVHGEKISPKLMRKVRDISALYKEIMQITSECIVLFLRVFPNLSKNDKDKKEEILKLIDSSLISQESIKKIKGLLK